MTGSTNSRPSYRRYSEPRERERDRTPLTSSERSRQWWTPEKRASRDDSGFKPVPNVAQRHVTTSSIRPAAESTVTISAAEYRELQKQARELRQLRDRPVFPDPPARRSEPKSTRGLKPEALTLSLPCGGGGFP